MLEVAQTCLFGVCASSNSCKFGSTQNYWTTISIFIGPLKTFMCLPGVGKDYLSNV